MEDIITYGLIAGGWITTILLFVLFVMNKKSFFGFKSSLRKKDPLVLFLHPPSNTIKPFLAKWDKDNENEILIHKKNNAVGYPEDYKIKVGKAILDGENGQPIFLAVWNDKTTIDIDLEEKKLSVDREGNKIALLRTFELMYAWLSLGKKTGPNIEKILLLLLLGAIAVLAINGYFTYQIMQKLPQAGLILFG